MRKNWGGFVATIAVGVMLGMSIDIMSHLARNVMSPGDPVVLGSGDIATFVNRPGDTKSEVLILINSGKVRQIAGIDGVNPETPVHIEGKAR